MIFGDINIQEIAISYKSFSLRELFSNHHATAIDFYLNYLAGVCLFTFFVMSFCLNPFLVHYNLKQPANPLSKLFIVLHVCDFITNLYHPIVLSVTMIRPQNIPALLEQAGVWRQLLAFPVYVFMFSRYGVALCLAVTRYGAVTRLFESYRDNAILAILIVYSSMITIYFYYTTIGYGLYTPAPYIPRHTGLVFSFPVEKEEDYTAVNITKVLLTAIPVLLGSALSGITLCKVSGVSSGRLSASVLLGSKVYSASSNRFQDAPGRAHVVPPRSFRTLKIITLINLSGVVFLLFLILNTSYNYRKMYVTFLSHAGIPFFFAAITPVVCLYNIHRKCKEKTPQKGRRKMVQFQDNPQKDDANNNNGNSGVKRHKTAFQMRPYPDTIKEESLPPLKTP